MSRPRRRLLILAPDCDGTDVGESWVAMQWARGLAAHHDVTVLLQSKRDRARVAPQLPGVEVVEWRQPPVVGRYERLNSLLKPAYLLYYLRARRWIAKASRAGRSFDIAHQLTPVSLRYPTPLAHLGLPYVLGPMGGSLPSPPAFAAEEGGSPWFTRLRILDQWRLEHDPWLRRGLQDASIVFVIADYVRVLLGSIPLQRLEVEADIGVADLPRRQSAPSSSGPIRLLFVGRVIRTKGVRDAIRAVALTGRDDVVLDVVGGGDDLAACQELAVELSVSEKVLFHGRRPRAEVDTFYERADVFLFPSYREPGGIVVGEAMSWGLPAIVCATGGPASTVGDGAALVVPADSPTQYAEGLAAAINRLCDDSGLRRRLGTQARARAAELLLWERKVVRMLDWYERVLQDRGPASPSREATVEDGR